MSDQFTSQGFDLDALASTETDRDDVVYEIGGGTTVVDTPKMAAPAATTSADPVVDIVIAESEESKRQGNEEFKKGSYLEAYDLYTEAIEACPGVLKGEGILKQRDEFDEAERAKAFSRQRVDEETRRKEKDSDKKEELEKPKPLAQFELPKQPYGNKLAIYYCNRAAALVHMERYDDAISDCDVSTLLNPKYAKGYVRRSAAYEKSDKTDEALRDAKKALELEPSNVTLKKSVARLQKIEDERLEKLKDETLGKLKDLGNSILGNFGLSLDNFGAVQDPSTGSYNISFNQNNSTNV